MCITTVKGNQYNEEKCYPGLLVLKKDKKLFLFFTEIGLLVPCNGDGAFCDVIMERDGYVKFNGFKFPVLNREPFSTRSEKIHTEIEDKENNKVIPLTLYAERINRATKLLSITID